MEALPHKAVTPMPTQRSGGYYIAVLDTGSWSRALVLLACCLPIDLNPLPELAALSKTFETHVCRRSASLRRNEKVSGKRQGIRKNAAL